MSDAPQRDPAVERRANRMLVGVIAFLCALLVVRAWVGTSLGGGNAERTVHGYGMVFVQGQHKGFVHEQVTTKSADGKESTATKWKPAADGQAPEREWTEWTEVPGDA